MALEIVGARGRALIWHIVRNQLGATRPALPAHDNDFADTRVLGQRAFDLAELDAVAPDLDLLVDTPEEFDRSVVPVANQIAGAVHTLPGPSSEWMRPEALGRQLWTMQVSTRHPFAPDVQLAGNADRSRPEVLVQDVEFCVRDRPADRDSPFRASYLEGRRPNRGLRRTVHVDQVASHQRPQFGRQRRREGLPTNQELAQPSQRFAGLLVDR